MASFLFPIVVLVLVLLQTSLAVPSCRVHPEFWCDDPQIAKECGVVEQCKTFAVTNAKPVEVAMYYESMCPGCRQMIQNSMDNAVANVLDIMNLTLVPYGNTREKYNGTWWVFDCQHGEEECFGDLGQTCATHYAKEFKDLFQYIYCMMSAAATPYHTVKACAEFTTFDVNALMKCVGSKEGNDLEHQMGLRTEALQPPHQYTPWVTINGKHTEELQSAAMKDLTKLVCKTYTGPKPAGCSN